jgi:hypothetical protein
MAALPVEDRGAIAPVVLAKLASFPGDVVTVDDGEAAKCRVTLRIAPGHRLRIATKG